MTGRPRPSPFEAWPDSEGAGPPPNRPDTNIPPTPSTHQPKLARTCPTRPRAAPLEAHRERLPDWQSGTFLRTPPANCGPEPRRPASATDPHHEGSTQEKRRRTRHVKRGAIDRGWMKASPLGASAIGETGRRCPRVPKRHGQMANLPPIFPTTTNREPSSRGHRHREATGQRLALRPLTNLKQFRPLQPTTFD